MKKILALIVSWFIFFWLNLSFTQAQSTYEDKPTVFVEQVVSSANDEWVVVRKEWVDFNGWWVKSTLEQVTKSKITSEYINWLGYLALSIAVVLIIYNWVLLISSRWNDAVFKKVQTRLVNIIIWIVVIFAAYMLIKLVLSVLSSIFPQAMPL